MNRIVIVGCVATKSDQTSSIADLYSSPLFRRRRKYAEETGDPWGVLSAKYGLIPSWSDRTFAPYDLTLTEVPESRGIRGHSKQWIIAGVASTLAGTGEYGFGQHLSLDTGRPPTRVVGATLEVHAGIEYVDLVRRAVREHDLIEASGVKVHHPVEGLQIGQQLQWYADTLSGDIAEQPLLL